MMNIKKGQIFLNKVLLQSLKQQNARRFSQKNSNSENTNNSAPDDEYEEDENKFKFSSVFKILLFGLIGTQAYARWDNQKNSKVYLPYAYEAINFVPDSCFDFFDLMTKPASDKILPTIPVIPGIIPLRKTLVLNMSDTIIYSKVRFGKGPEVTKRPGLDEFISKLSRSYELVILSDDPHHYVETIVGKIDPTYQKIQAFGREFFCLEKGKAYRDINCLNRNHQDIIVIDVEKERSIKHLDNLILLPKFEGDKEDNSLRQLIPLLQHLSSEKVEDIRTALKEYGENPAESYNQELKQKLQELEKKNTMNKMRTNQTRVPNYLNSFSNSSMTGSYLKG